MQWHLDLSIRVHGIPQTCARQNVSAHNMALNTGKGGVTTKNEHGCNYISMPYLHLQMNEKYRQHFFVYRFVTCNSYCAFCSKQFLSQWCIIVGWMFLSSRFGFWTAIHNDVLCMSHTNSCHWYLYWRIRLRGVYQWIAEKLSIVKNVAPNMQP